MKKRHLPLTAVKALALCVSVSLLSACQSTSAISEKSREFKAPEQWANNAVAKIIPEQLQQDWLGISNNTALEQLITLAITHNFELQQSYLAIEQAKLQLTVQQASDFPELNLDINQTRRKVVVNDIASISNSAELALQLGYEVDLWGKLSDQQQQAQLQLAAAKAHYQHARVSLIASITTSWYTLVEAEKLLNLYQERLVNLTSNLAIINSSYQLGLSSALDVYLSQNELHSEQARVQRQQQSVSEAKRALQNLITQYPSGTSTLLNGEKAWPELAKQLTVDVPSSVLTKRYDIMASWLELLSLDAALAVAHKQRFPQLRLSATVGDSSDELGDLLSGNSLSWSLLGNITAPLFNAGLLKANEQQAKITVQQKEQQYLSELYQAFSQVENQLDNHQSLSEQLSLQIKAQQNAEAAESLAFNQYQKGLVSYTTVLESQRRAFDNQTAAIQIKTNLIKNRIALYLSMGGQTLVNNNLLADQ